jgi:hypothetical protein
VSHAQKVTNITANASLTQQTSDASVTQQTSDAHLSTSTLVGWSDFNNDPIYDANGNRIYERSD